MVNLRGVKEAGFLFAMPTYGFIRRPSSCSARVRALRRRDLPACGRPEPITAGVGAVGVLVLLRAFASGASALTGVEAIANGVNAFRRPQSANAARTLAVLGTIAVSLFLGVSWLAVHMHALPSTDAIPPSCRRSRERPSRWDRVESFMYWAIQVFTFACSCSRPTRRYQGFPRLAALLANDRFFARQFTNLGDRLVFSNGILVLTGCAVALLGIYDANVNSLIHLYVIGVFTAFTLSQAGMIRYWLRTRDQGWQYRGAINTARRDRRRAWSRSSSSGRSSPRARGS